MNRQNFNNWASAKKYVDAGGCSRPGLKPGSTPSAFCWLIWAFTLSSSLLIPIYTLVANNSDSAYQIAGLSGVQICSLPFFTKFMLIFVTLLGGFIQTYVFANYCHNCAGSTMEGFGGLMVTSALTNIAQYLTLALL